MDTYAAYNEYEQYKNEIRRKIIKLRPASDIKLFEDMQNTPANSASMAKRGRMGQNNRHLDVDFEICRNVAGTRRVHPTYQAWKHRFSSGYQVNPELYSFALFFKEYNDAILYGNCIIEKDLKQQNIPMDDRIYSFDTITLVPQFINKLISERTHSTNGYGATKHGNRWQAGVRKYNKTNTFGTFDTAHEASAVAIMERKKYVHSIACIFDCEIGDLLRNCADQI